MARRIYIAGQMRGIKWYNFPAFDEAEQFLEGNGWEPVNPARIDREKRDFDPKVLPADHDWSTEPNGWIADEIITDDIDNYLSTCDAIYMLKGWMKSVGARREFAAAVTNGLEILFQSDDDKAGGETILQEADRLVSLDRRNEYGHPAHDFKRQAKMWSAVLMDKLKPGEEISAQEVGLCMVCTKISRNINKSKRDNLVDGAGYFKCVNLIENYDG